MPDMPQRIATDTSQKVGIRFGETIKSYVAEGRDLNSLVSIPLAIAGWLRYLLAIDDNGNAFEVSADPLKDELQAKLSGIEFGKPETVTDQLDGILSNASIFGSDLTKTVLADKIKRTSRPRSPVPVPSARPCTSRERLRAASLSLPPRGKVAPQGRMRGELPAATVTGQ